MIKLYYNFIIHYFGQIEVIAEFHKKGEKPDADR